jgi:hypothetical protein
VTIQDRGIRSGRIRIRKCQHLVFDGFTITSMNQAIFVEGGSQYVTVQNCTVHHVGQEGIGVKQNSDHVTIQNCTIHDTGRWTDRRFPNGEGIYIGTSSSGPKDNTGFTVVRDNTIYNTTDEAVELKPGTHDALVEGNTIHDVVLPQFGASVGAIELNQAIIPRVQEWPSNPNHVVRNNLVHNTSTAIRAGTGSSVYNNVIYGVRSKCYGIYVDNLVKDDYPRRICQNTVNLPESRAIVVAGLPANQVDVKNNVGPATAGNMATNAAYFADPDKGDFHLSEGAAPIGAGMDLADLLAAVPGLKTDKDGVSRPQGSGWDVGAYEHQKR